MPTKQVDVHDHRELQEVADILARSKKVIVVTGAGISTNSGIPDFRSENGLYSLIQAQYDNGVRADSDASTPALTRSTTPSTQLSQEADDQSQLPPSSQSSNASLPSNMKGKDLFDSLIWKDPLSTAIFYTFIASLRKKIREEIHSATPTHKFIRALRDGGRLVRCYTQNIDGLEARDGLCTEIARGKGNRSRFLRRVVEQPRPETAILPGSEMDGGCEVVQLHGDLEYLRCGLCCQLTGWEEDEREASLLQGMGPACGACAGKNQSRRDSGKRGTAVGLLRPNVVLYGEEHPRAHLLSPITTHDLSIVPDILLILGTSLRVHGLKVLVREFAKAVHARGRGKGRVIFVNRTKPSESVWADVIDYWVGIDCDAWVEDLRERRSSLWERQGMLQVPVVKQTGLKVKDRASEKPSKKTAVPRAENWTSNTRAESDKENAQVPKAKAPRTRKPATADGASKMRVKKTAAAGDKAKAKPPTKTPKPKARRVTATLVAKGATTAPVQPAGTPPKTPSKVSVFRDVNMDGDQLPTPPTSGAGPSPTSTSTSTATPTASTMLPKRGLAELSDGDQQIGQSPSKRAKISPTSIRFILNESDC
ncbi:MAG: hypothetical protein M1838_005217 [Thelocarpon superellum]|nr:MAG: hypothetical protein M1838_005217 [Thelocarpon superellum]